MCVRARARACVCVCAMIIMMMASGREFVAHPLVRWHQSATRFREIRTRYAAVAVAVVTLGPAPTQGIPYSLYHT